MTGRISKLGGLVLFVLMQFSQFGLAPQNNIDLSKLHPSFWPVVAENGGQMLLTKPESKYTDASGAERYGVIIRTNDVPALTARNIHCNSSYNGFVTAKLTAEQMRTVLSMESVRYIDMPTLNYPTTNVSTGATGAKLLHNNLISNAANKGNGAIVLVFDTGIDFDHIDFKNPQDTTKSRILNIWDQTINATGGETAPSGFNYGVEYSKTQIDNEIDGTPAGFVRQNDTNGHGTHVAGTAAGSGAKFTGIAPEADIIVVKGGNGGFPEDNIIDAFTYAANKSNQYGKPIVVNLSLGGQMGPHDGTRDYEKAIDLFNSEPGQIVVVAAGNDGDSNLHKGGMINTAGSATFQIDIPTYAPEANASNDEFIFALYYDEVATVTAKVTSPTGVVYERTSGLWGESLTDTDGKIYLENRRDGNVQSIVLWVRDADAAKPPKTGRWTLELLSASATANYDGWITKSYIGTDFQAVILVGGDNVQTVTMPGTSEKAITVGAYVTKPTWPAADGGQYGWPGHTVNYLAAFSGKGPTRDARLKPEITAPGTAIVAAMSKNTSPAAAIQLQNPDGIHVSLQGTSMATPHVAGAVALLLANDPSMTADEVKSVLTNTAIQDNRTGAVPNYNWGYGKMDILQAFVSQAVSDTVVTRSMLSYENLISGPYFLLSGTNKMAVRYKAPHGGKISGAILTTLIHNTTVNPIISGTGNLLVAVHEDNGGIPGARIGQQVSHPLVMLDPGTENYINMLPTGVSTTTDQFYHVVFGLSNPADEVKIKFDSGSLDRPDNHSFISEAGVWKTMSERFGNPYNLLFKSEITSLDYLNSINEELVQTVRSFALDQNYPNPFNPSTKIRYHLVKNGPVELSVFDVLGRKVMTLIDENKIAGDYTVEWTGRNSEGNLMPSGVYFYRLKTADGLLSKKMLLVK